MDYTPQEQSIDAGISSRQSTIAQANGEMAALQAAKDIISTGYQSDATAIAAAVASQVGDIQAENTTLTAQVLDLSTQLKTANETIATLQTPPDSSTETEPSE